MNPVYRHAPGYHFLGYPENGFTVRWGNTLRENPMRAPWPELADISVSNRCTKGCSFCYRDSTPEGALMSLEDYEFVLDSLMSPVWGPPFQVALGGGEPLEHPQILEILDATRKRGIIANFTTNGRALDADLASALVGRVGAVALSVARLGEYDAGKVRLLSSRGVRTHLHFLLDSGSLEEALSIARGERDALLKDLSGLVFLTRKPQGRSSAEGLLSFEDSRLNDFLDAVASGLSTIPLGFDACAVPLLLHHGRMDPQMMDACECGFFSVYVDEKLEVRPCSFSKSGQNGWNLREESFEKIWNERFEPYRRRQSADTCVRPCPGRSHCRGKCPLFPEISFCFETNSANR